MAIDTIPWHLAPNLGNYIDCNTAAAVKVPPTEAGANVMLFVLFDDVVFGRTAEGVT